MKTNATLLLLVLCLFATAVCFASDSSIGTWKLNEAKSKFSAGAPKVTKVTIAVAGDSLKVTVDGTGADGKAMHNTWTGKYDGKDYPVTGDPNTDTRSYKMTDAHSMALTVKKGGKVVISGTIAISANGKTRTVTTTGTDPQGKKISATAVYDKQ